MNCAEVTSLVSEYLDHRLDTDRVAELVKHARACAGCCRQIDELQATIALVSSLDPVEAPPDFTVEVNRKIDAAEKKSFLYWLFRPPKIKVSLEVTALLLVSTLAVYFYRQTSEMPSVAPLSKAREVESRRQVESPRESLRQEKLGPGGPGKRKAQPEPMAEKAQDQTPLGAPREEQRQTAPVEGKLDAPGVVQPGAPPAPAAGKAEPQVSHDTPVPTLPAPARPSAEIVAKDPRGYEDKVKEILKNFDGKLLTRKEESGGISLLIELPETRRAEFLAALGEERFQAERRREKSFSPPASRPAGEPQAKAASNAVLTIRILPLE
jgi:hypothetical protein